MERKRTALYCRVDQGGSPETRRIALDMQKRQLESYAATEGLQVSGYYEDDGLPGHDPARPGLRQLMEDHDAGAFEQVLVASRSRLYRGRGMDEPEWPFEVCSLNLLENDPGCPDGGGFRQPLRRKNTERSRPISK